ncbi:4-hydroxybenzoate solanesyltransferase [Spirulina sp. CCNP1310]|uniref:4-hydroxybenzoate solanesyltransferase n=1 Tax=Spirulina sp. CCNP1310 TaxID=3110249 RepID=UPI002B213FBE|nr:4-hydroxybenzoate solanesyltransferase [Spirulina sp. CCNP1310]MEA5419956.1 4-hydroxybenzoate solanesyltransferase [Spirulina sp. CCNP1310]
MTLQSSSEPRWQTILRLLRWDKPAGRLILMIPALWAVFLAAKGLPPWPLVGVIILGSLATSAAGCVANDLWDRDIDPQVERTQARPLAARSLSIQTGIAVGIVALACAAGLAFYLKPLSFWLAVAAVPVILLYPAAKRVFPVPQLVLAIAWGFAVLISWTAVTGSLTLGTGLLWGAVVLWTLGFDTVYAMSDRPDDARIGIQSSALFFGSFAPHAVGLFFLGTAACLAVMAVVISLYGSFWVSWAIALLLWGNQTRLLFNPDLPRACYGQIFSQNVAIGFILLAGMITGVLWS